MRYEFGGLVFGGAYTWRGLFSEFYGTSRRMKAAITFVADLSIVYLNTGFITG